MLSRLLGHGDNRLPERGGLRVEIRIGNRLAREETFRLLFIAITQLSFQPVVFFHELVDSALLRQAILADGVLRHPRCGCEARKLGASAWHRCLWASRRSG